MESHIIAVIVMNYPIMEASWRVNYSLRLNKPELWINLGGGNSGVVFIMILDTFDFFHPSNLELKKKITVLFSFL